MKRSYWWEDQKIQKMEEVHKSLAMWVCREDVPARACSDDPSFKQFLRALNPDFWPCFETLEHNCLKIYAGEKEKVKEALSKICGHVNLSVDLHVLEEHELSKDYYVFLSAHFIDDDWKLQKWVIKYSSVGYGENKDLRIETILKSLKEWDIDSKVFTMTTLVTKDTVDKVKEEIHERRRLPMDGQLFHVRCCTRIITRMMLIGFREIKSIIDKVKQLSWSKSDPLWYLISFKLEQALELDAMGEFSSEHVKQNYEVPSSEEWGKVRVMCRIANRIHDIVEGLFKVKNPTTNLFLPHLLEVRSYLVQESNSDDDFVKGVTLKMLKFFDQYWKDAYLVLAIAAFMDPRYKMKFIEFGDGQSNPASILETIRGLHDNYVVQDNERKYLMSDSISDSNEEGEEEEEGHEGHSETRCIDLLGRLSVLSN